MGTFQNLVTAVALIIEEYMADMFHVNTNLMGTSRFKNAFYKSDIAQTLQNPVMGHGMLSLIIGQNGHLHAVSGIPANVSGDGSLVLFNGSPHQGTVASFGGFVEELHTKVGFGIWCFGYDEQSGSVFIDAMNQTDVRVVGIVVGIIFHVPGDGVH